MSAAVARILTVLTFSTRTEFRSEPSGIKATWVKACCFSEAADPYMREEKPLGEMAGVLQQLVIAPAALSWLEATMTASDKTETGAREDALKQLKSERNRLQSRVETMYLDRLDGRISAEFFDEKSREWREQQKHIEIRMNQLLTTNLRSASEAVQIMKSVSQACAAFSGAQPPQQRALAAALMENATWKAEKFESDWKSPFDKMALSNSISRTKEMERPRRSRHGVV